MSTSVCRECDRIRPVVEVDGHLLCGVCYTRIEGPAKTPSDLTRGSRVLFSGRRLDSNRSIEYHRLRETMIGTTGTSTATLCGETFSHGVWIAREHAVKFASACPTCFPVLPSEDRADG